MTINDINRSVYESDDVVQGYQSIQLQPPEIVIFFKYKEAIFNNKLLDIGCGTGRTTHYLSKFTNQYRAIDYSQSMVDTCKLTYPTVEVTKNNVQDLSEFVNNSFDTVLFSYNGIDYIDHDSRIQGIKEIHRVLKDGGLFIFSTHNRDNLKTLPQPRLEFSLNPFGLMRNIKDYFSAKRNFAKNASMQINSDEYQIIIDSSDNFQLLTYYISMEKQIEQLQNIGFKVIDIFNLRGEPVSMAKGDGSSCWIYFVARKR